MAAIRISCSTKDYLPLDSLVEFQGDLKSLSDENYQKLKSEILQTGFAFPIYVWQSKDGINYILGGHQRTRTLRKLQKEGHEIPLIPCVLIEAENIKQAKRRIVQDVSQYGHVEKEGLYEFMNGESELGLDDLKNSFDLPGIDLDSFALEYFEDNTVPPGEDDENIEPPVEPKSKLGDLWKLGNHRLLCGDSTMIDHVERLMDGKKADMVFTDPPYNVDYSNADRPKAGKIDLGRIKNDVMGGLEFLDFLRAVFSCLDLATKDNSTLYMFFADKTVEFYNAISESKFQFKQVLIWKKPMLLGRSRYQWAHEPCLFGIKGSPYFTDDRTKTTVWDFGGYNKSKNVHPTQKPVIVPEEAIKNSSRNGESVLDLFGGSGSTLIACEQTKRHCYMMELEPKYIDVILNRWSKLTGKDPVRDDGVKWSELNG